MLEWTSENEYFKKILNGPTAITLPLAAHVRRGVIIASVNIWGALHNNSLSKGL